MGALRHAARRLAHTHARMQSLRHTRRHSCSQSGMQALMQSVRHAGTGACRHRGMHALRHSGHSDMQTRDQCRAHGTIGAGMGSHKHRLGNHAH